MKILFSITFLLITLFCYSQEFIDFSNPFDNYKRIGIKLVEDTANVKYQLNKVTGHINRENYQLAINTLKIAESYNSNETEIYSKRAAIYKRLELNDSIGINYQKAIDLFENGYPLNELPFNLYNSYGTLCLKNEEYNQAETLLSKALNYKLSVNSLYNRGVARLYLGKTQESCSDLLWAKSLGVQQADKLISTWCKNCESEYSIPETIEIPENAINYYQSGLDTLHARIYYYHNWNIAHEKTHIYRECKWIQTQQKYDGEFMDFNSNHRVAQGSYKNGLKHGIYTKYFLNGNVETIGNFKDDLPIGIWRYYYPNKQLKLIVAYNGNNFDVKAYFNENGTQLLKEGNGKWKFAFTNDRGYIYTLKGQYKNFKRVGTWTLDCNTCMQEVIEKYTKDGEYKNTKTKLWQHSHKTNEPFFTSWILMELRHEQIAKLQFRSNDVFTAYPFFTKREELTTKQDAN
ncbi:MAG: hypothetical protein PF541_13090 [Prolixibacteraceae bacterium]|jgi:tetratricopeptide (TPR) repeat protein|nr:hypothetical protein [Prolixibacteraceae bacterium]